MPDNVSGFTDETLELHIAGQTRRAVVRTPRLCRHPGLLIVLGGERTWPFTGSDGIWISTGAALAAGHRVASFDLPYHGERADHLGEGLTGIAAAISAGMDVFEDIRQTGNALIDLCLARGLAGPGGIAIEGTSRGGLAALHIMAGDARVDACAIHSSVTHLPTLREFAHLADHPIIQRSNASALIDGLKDRPLLIAMGESDPRVGADHCFEFHARLAAHATRMPPELWTAPGVSHGATFPYEAGYQTATGFLLRCLAEKAKLLPFQHGNA